MSSWLCQNDDNGFCKKLKKDCDPGMKGCSLEGKVQDYKELAKEENNPC